MTILFRENELIIGSATIPENVTFKFSDILKIGGGGSSPSWQDIVLSGNGSLTLTNAKANGLNYLKLFGECELGGDPTPDEPTDIYCNNGFLAARHQSGLPAGYQPYEHITASGNQWLNTGVKLASTDIVETVFKNSARTGYGALYGVFAMGDSSAFYANGTYYGYDETNGKVDTGVSVDTEWHTLRHDFANGVITLDGNDITYTPFEFDNTKDNYLFARYYSNNYGYGFKGSCKRYKVIRNGELICDLIPAIQLSDNTIGMYDLVNADFRSNLGSGDFTIANPIDDLELYVEEENIETVAAATIYDSADGQGTYVSPSSSTTNRIYKDLGQLSAGTYMIGMMSGGFEIILQYRNAPIGSTATVYGNIDTWTSSGVYAITDNTLYYGVAIRYPDNSSITPADFNGTIALILEKNTATATNLFGVGDYKDVQEVKTGAITRNVGIKILDGTENWESTSTSGLWLCRRNIEATVLPNTCICTHFLGVSTTTSGLDMPDLSIRYGVAGYNNRLYIRNNSLTDVDELKTFLASQYATGTPVIVVYPLATPTTESVTGQHLTIRAGTNLIQIAQASIDNLPLEVSYKGTIEQQGE